MIDADTPHKKLSLTAHQVKVLIMIERTGAGCSMVAIIFTVLSYLIFKKLRTTPNLFLVFASIANAGASVASMIGYDGLQHGQDSHLCQAQAFIFEWFMQSDPWWSFAMAVNVFLVFFNNADPSSFRKYAWVYLVVCFGGPLIPAIILISVRAGPRELIYGDAALWCWIGADWALLRLYSYYIPIWFCIIASIIIYIAVGYHVFHHRNQLRNFANENWANGEKGSTVTESDIRDSGEETLTGRSDFYGTAVTEVQITSDCSRNHQLEDLLERPAAVHSPLSPGLARPWIHPHMYEHTQSHSPTKSQRFETVCSSDGVPPPPETVLSRLREAKSNASLKLRRLDPIKMAYLRTSFIFGFAVLITWIPSSINRIYSLTNDDKISFPLSVASGYVLPLQGVWNAIIYFTTSWTTVKEDYKSIKAKLVGPQSNSIGVSRLESRLEGQNERRNTFERSRMLSCRIGEEGRGQYEDIELWEQSNCASETK